MAVLCMIKAMITEAIISRMNRVFLGASHDFTLVWTGKIYELKHQNKAFCHPLEVGLIGQKNLTGYKIKDIETVLKRSKAWILGFHHALVQKPMKYKKQDYVDGYDEGSNFANQTKAKSL